MQSKAQNDIFSELHISYSQVFTYLSCSLKYQLKYVLRHPPERVGLALPFGKALHKSLERYYLSYAQGQIEELGTLKTLFGEVLASHLENMKDLVVFSKTMPNADSAIEMGYAMLKAFCESIDLTGWKIIGVELPLSAQLYTDTGQILEFKLIGFIDLLLADPTDQLVVVDHKTVARAKSQADVDADPQMSTYSYLLAANHYVFPTAPVKGRKLEKPKMTSPGPYTLTLN
jgi:putative RecB family exonuclease